MTLTLLALFLTPLSLKMVLDPEGSHKIFQSIVKDESSLLMMAIFNFLFALLIFSGNSLQFTWEWSSLMGWIGALSFLKGCGALIPGLTERSARAFFKTNILPIYGFLGALLSLAFVYIDLNLL